MILKKENKEYASVFSTPFTGNLICIHFGNGDEQDYNTINTFLTELNIKFSLNVFPGLPYGCLSIPPESEEILNKSLDATHKCIQLNFSNNSRWIFFINTVLTPEHFSKSAAIDFPDSIVLSKNEDMKVTTAIFPIELLNNLKNFVLTQPWIKIAFRRAQFYGNEHIESSDYVKSTIPIPEIIKECLKYLKEKNSKEFDTITIAEVSPGKGIPLAVESHLFEEVIIRLP